jgi:hypothetical protein
MSSIEPGIWINKKVRPMQTIDVIEKMGQLKRHCQISKNISSRRRVSQTVSKRNLDAGCLTSSSRTSKPFFFRHGAGTLDIMKSHVVSDVPASSATQVSA